MSEVGPSISERWSTPPDSIEQDTRRLEKAGMLHTFALNKTGLLVPADRQNTSLSYYEYPRPVAGGRDSGRLAVESWVVLDGDGFLDPKAPHLFGVRSAARMYAPEQDADDIVWVHAVVERTALARGIYTPGARGASEVWGVEQVKTADHKNILMNE